MSLSVVHAIARLNVGGAALSVLELAAEQRRRGHEVLVVAGSLAPGEESMEYLAAELGVPVLPLPELQRELSPRADLRAIRALRGLMRRTRPDVLHTHTAKAGATGRLAALTLGPARPRARVHTFHGHVLHGYFDTRRERAFRLVERALARTSAVVAVSDEVRDDLAAYGVAAADRITVIPYGFDLDRRVAAAPGARERVRGSLGLDAGTFAVGFVGRLTAIKRPHDLVRTLAGLGDRGVDAVLVAVGDGEERPAVEALAAGLGVAGRCRFAGYRSDVPDWYAAFDAFLLVSANEGTPVVAIEALAAGLPVVATDAGGTATVVRHGETGLLAPVGDVGALAGGLERLARDPALRRAMGRAGAADVRARFATARMADDVEALYRRLLAR